MFGQALADSLTSIFIVFLIFSVSSNLCTQTQFRLSVVPAEKSTAVNTSTFAGSASSTVCRSVSFGRSRAKKGLPREVITNGLY